MSNNTPNNTPKKGFLARLFSHNITLLVLAFIISFAAWFIINISSETETNVRISNIPINIELSESAVEDGMKIYGADGITASVEVSGNRVTVGSLTASDIYVGADQSGSILSPGSYTLMLNAKKSGLKSNYNIVSSVNPNSITVFADREKTAEFTVVNGISVNVDADKYYINSSLSNSKVTVTGPETMVNQIKSVKIVDTVTPDGSPQFTVQEKILFFGEEDNKGSENEKVTPLDLPLVKADIDTISVTIQVLPVKTMKLDVNVLNAPSGAPKVSISPSTVKIAGTQENLDKIEGDTLLLSDPIDFSNLKNEKVSEKIGITAPSGCKLTSEDKEATVTFDLSSYSSNTITGKIASRLDPTEYTVAFNSNNAQITVYGPEDVVKNITASDLTVIANFTDWLNDMKKDDAISITVPLDIELSSSFSGCWVYGKYNVEVNVKKLKD